MHTRLLWVFALGFSFCAPAENWPCWRGPRGDGSSLDNNVPVEWSESKNVRWKVGLPGVGNASPVVFQDKIFPVSAPLDSEERALLYFDRKTGQKPGDRDGESHIMAASSEDGSAVWKTPRQNKTRSYYVPTTAGNRIFFLGANGTTTVVEVGPQFKVLAKNDLKDKFFASPAISNGEIFLRGEKRLYCIRAAP